MPSLFLTSALVSGYSKLMMTSDHQLALITLVLEVNNWHFCPAPPTDQFLGDPTCSDRCRRHVTTDLEMWSPVHWGSDDLTCEPMPMTDLVFQAELSLSVCMYVLRGWYWEQSCLISSVPMLGRMLGPGWPPPRAHSPPLGIRMPTLALSSATPVDARTSSGSHFFQGFYPSYCPSYWTI